MVNFFFCVVFYLFHLLSRQATRRWGEGGKGRPPLFFYENQKECPDFEKNIPDYFHL